MKFREDDDCERSRSAEPVKLDKLSQLKCCLLFTLSSFCWICWCWCLLLIMWFRFSSNRGVFVCDSMSWLTNSLSWLLRLFDDNFGLTAVGFFVFWLTCDTTDELLAFVQLLRLIVEPNKRDGHCCTRFRRLCVAALGFNRWWCDEGKRGSIIGDDWIGALFLFFDIRFKSSVLNLPTVVALVVNVLGLGLLFLESLILIVLPW